MKKQKALITRRKFKELVVITEADSVLQHTRLIEIVPAEGLVKISVDKMIEVTK